MLLYLQPHEHLTISEATFIVCKSKRLTLMPILTNGTSTFFVQFRSRNIREEIAFDYFETSSQFSV